MSDSTNTKKPTDADTSAIMLVGIPGAALIFFGVLGMLGMAGQAIYDSYGPLPLLIMNTVAGLGLIYRARRMVQKLQGGT